MTLVFSQPGRFSSPLNRLDPRWKLAAFALLGLAVAFLRTLPASSVALLLGVLMVTFARIPWGWYVARLSGVLLFLGLFAVFLPFTVDSDQHFVLGPLSLSVRGLTLAGVILAKGACLATLAIALTATAPFEDLMKAAQRLHIPGLLVQLVLLTYRYLHLLREEFGRLRISLRVRGFRNRASLHCYRTVSQVTGTLLVRSHERAERVGHAMRCRGLDGRFRSLANFVTRSIDVAFFMVTVGCAVALLSWDIALR